MYNLFPISMYVWCPLDKHVFHGLNPGVLPFGSLSFPPEPCGGHTHTRTRRYPEAAQRTLLVDGWPTD